MLPSRSMIIFFKLKKKWTYVYVYRIIALVRSFWMFRFYRIDPVLYSFHFNKTRVYVIYRSLIKICRTQNPTGFNSLRLDTRTLSKQSILLTNGSLFILAKSDTFFCPRQILLELCCQHYSLIKSTTKCNK